MGPRSETPRRAQTPRLNPMQKRPEVDNDSSPGSSIGEHAQVAAGVAAEIIAVNCMREQYVAAHEGLVAKRAKRSATKCLRVACADSNCPNNGNGSPHSSDGEH